MSKEDEFDIDKEIKKISKHTNVNILKTEMAFDKRLEQLDKDIDKVIKSKEKLFDDAKGLSTKHITNDYSPSSLDRYREKLKNI